MANEILLQSLSSEFERRSQKQFVINFFNEFELRIKKKQIVLRNLNMPGTYVKASYLSSLNRINIQSFIEYKILVNKNITIEQAEKELKTIWLYSTNEVKHFLIERNYGYPVRTILSFL